MPEYPRARGAVRVTKIMAGDHTLGVSLFIQEAVCHWGGMTWYFSVANFVPVGRATVRETVAQLLCWLMST